MKIKLTAEIEPARVYELVRPIKHRRKCNAAMRRAAKIQFILMLSEGDGGWAFPTANFLAQKLMNDGLAIRIPVATEQSPDKYANS